MSNKIEINRYMTRLLDNKKWFENEFNRFMENWYKLTEDIPEMAFAIYRRTIINPDKKLNNDEEVFYISTGKKSIYKRYESQNYISHFMEVDIKKEKDIIFIINGLLDSLQKILNRLEYMSDGYEGLAKQFAQLNTMLEKLIKD